jgi:hypothetical protein
MQIDLGALIPARTQAAVIGTFTVSAIPGFERHLIGRDEHGRACMLFATSDVGVRAPLRLGGLAVQYALRCSVRLSGSTDERVLSVVTSTNDSADGERYFLHVMGTLLEIVGDSPTLTDLTEAMAQFAEIFQRLASAPRESLVGIVGELMVILCASDAQAAAHAWRADPDERFDFARGTLRLEVKSSSARARVHDFSFEQCDVPAGCEGVVASVFVERSAGGLSLEDLLRLLEGRLTTSAAARLRIQQTLARTLGSELPAALGFAFDHRLAVSELKFFDFSDVPAIRGPLPNGVSRVRFSSDLGRTLASVPADLAVKCPDFRSFVPIATRLER